MNSSVGSAHSVVLEPHSILSDRYEILKKLGQGGMGAVYQAYDRVLQRVVAIKIMLSLMQIGEAEIARFKREAQALAQLQHPNIVALYDFHTEPYNYLVMEFIQGKTLLELIGNRALTFMQVANILEKCSRALHVAHQIGIIHRDIKPHNIMIETETNTPKVMDFGLAKMVSEQNITQNPSGWVGTIGYMPPEQAQRFSSLWNDPDQRNIKTQANNAFQPLAPKADPVSTVPPIAASSALGSASQTSASAALTQAAPSSHGSAPIASESLASTIACSNLPKTIASAGSVTFGASDNTAQTQALSNAPVPGASGSLASTIASSPLPKTLAMPNTPNSPASIASLNLGQTTFSSDTPASAASVYLAQIPPSSLTEATAQSNPYDQNQTTIQPEATSKLDGRSDVFSLGATLYHALTYFAPFLSPMAQLSFAAIIPPRHRNAEVPHDLETICLKCMEIKPANRYSSALELAEDLRRFQQNLPIHAKPASIITRSYKWMIRHPGYGLTALLIIITNFCVGIFSIYQALYAQLATNELLQLQNQTAMHQQTVAQSKEQTLQLQKTVNNLDKQNQTLKNEQSLLLNTQQVLLAEQQKLNAQMEEMKKRYNTIALQLVQTRKKVQEELKDIQKNSQFEMEQLQQLLDKKTQLDTYLAVLDNNTNQENQNQQDPNQLQEINQANSLERNQLSNLFFPTSTADFNSQGPLMIQLAQPQKNSTITNEVSRLEASIPVLLYTKQSWDATITYLNTSTSTTLTNVVITATWGPQLKGNTAQAGKIQNRQAIWNLLSLGPSQSKTFTLSFTNLSSGPCSLELVANNTENLTHQQSYLIEIQEPQSYVLTICPKYQTCPNPLDVSFVVSNPTIMPIQNVPVSVSWDAPFSVQASTGNPMITQNNARWAIPYLGANQTQHLSLKLSGGKPGMVSTVQVNQGNTEASTYTTQWDGPSAKVSEMSIRVPDLFIMTPKSPEYFLIEIEVKNNSKETISQPTLVLSSQPQTGMKIAGFLEYTSGAVLQSEMNQGNPIQCSVGNILPGQSRCFLAAAQPSNVSTYKICSTLNVRTRSPNFRGNLTTILEASSITEIRDLPKLFMSLHKAIDSDTYVGNEDLYIIEIQNRAFTTAPDFAGFIIFDPKYLIPTKVAPGGLNGTIIGKSNGVFFMRTTPLQYNESVYLQIYAKAIAPGTTNINGICNSYYAVEPSVFATVNILPK